MPGPIPAEWLPNAAIPITVIWIHPDYDDTCVHLKAARDWAARGEDYIRQIADLDPATRIVAVFAGHHTTEIGAAVNAW
jgi:hypothetical protein